MTNSLEHILVIDDEPDILEIVQLCLADVGGKKVTTMDSVADAICRMADISPDMILIDMMMPGISGVDALRLFRQDPKLCQIPIVLMTARVQPAEVQNYLTAGATAVIAKPFDPMTLADQVTKIWEESQGEGAC